MLTSVATPGNFAARASRIRRTTPHLVVPLVMIDVTVPGTSSAGGRSTSATSA
jgi:hypothetical protein